jgi:type IV pilus assembly protein PilM
VGLTFAFCLWVFYMSLLHSVTSLWKDPPPALAFELSEAGVAMARTGKAPDFDFRPLESGVLSVSPLRDNILDADKLAAAVRSMVPPNGSRKRRQAALILPDSCVRIAILDFDHFPSDAKEQLSLVRFRMKKSVPYDVESAMLSYHAQSGGNGKKVDVVVAVAPLEIISRYEAPFRAAAIEPGFVSLSALASLELIDEAGTVVVAKLSGRMLTIMVVSSRVLKLVRSLDLSQPGIPEIASDLYPTFVFTEDNLGVKAEKLLLAGFGNMAEDARAQFARELHLPVEVIRAAAGVAGENSLGLMGYLRSLAG